MSKINRKYKKTNQNPIKTPYFLVILHQIPKTLKKFEKLFKTPLTNP